MTGLLPRSTPVADRATRRAVLAAVLTATEALYESDPRRPNETLAGALERAGGAAAGGRDGTGGRAAAAIRTAAAYHAAGQLEDTFFALQCARDHLEV